MNLAFDSIDELNIFLRWADKYSSAQPVACVQGAGGSYTAQRRSGEVILHPVGEGGGGGGSSYGTLISATGGTGGGMGTGEAPRMPPPVTGDPSGACLVPETLQPGTQGVDNAPAATAEPPKRKRRTKAEIEADEKAAAAATQVGSVDIARVMNADGTVTTTSVGLPPDVKPEEVMTKPEGANPFAQGEHVHTGVQTAGETQNDEGTAEAGEPAVVTPFQHLTRAREFIAKHGMPKYNETFAKAGLDANVMAYTAYQRGVHMAIMDELDKG